MVMETHAATPGVLINLPPRLHFLIEPAIKFGRFQLPQERRTFAANITNADREELCFVRSKLEIDDYEEIELFFDKFEITKYPESARLYFLLFVIDAVLGELPSVESTYEDKIRYNTRNLSRFGSPRLASGRMWAAKWFAKNPAVDTVTVDLLRRACNDECAHVRLWAHAAVALIDKEYCEHIVAIKEIADSTPTSDDKYVFIRFDAGEAVQILEATRKE